MLGFVDANEKEERKKKVLSMRQSRIPQFELGTWPMPVTPALEKPRQEDLS